MERRGFLKGLLGASAGAILARKTVSAGEEDLLDTKQGSSIPLLEEVKGEEDKYSYVYNHTSTFMPTSTFIAPNSYYYLPTDKVIRLRASGPIKPGRWVALDNTFKVVPYDLETDSKYPPVGIALETVDYNNGSRECLVQVRTSKGWTAV